MGKKKKMTDTKKQSDETVVNNGPYGTKTVVNNGRYGTDMVGALNEMFGKDENKKDTPPTPPTIKIELTPGQYATLLQIFSVVCSRGVLQPEETYAFGLVYNKVLMAGKKSE